MRPPQVPQAPRAHVASLSRRTLLRGASTAAIAANLGVPHAAAAPATRVAPMPMPTPVPLRAVRLRPSPYRDALDANAAYVMRLSPDRLLHNYRAQAGLEPKGEVYGGWESDTIAGHTLGHYLSALALLHAQTGAEAPRLRAAYVVAELALCQRRGRDGFLCGFTRRREGRIEPGRAAFDEIEAGLIHSTGFDLNGAWSPLYNWHKLMAGLLDVAQLCGDRLAASVCLGLASYLGDLFDRLDEAQLQQVLACEYGGLNESFAELHGRTGDPRWLALARRIYDRRTLDPLARGEDDLANLHANTQIPKIVGLARLYEITGEPAYATASLTFWNAVTAHHSYVIGGNGDREYFTAADSIADHVTEQTCETCASYNMLKLTRQIYARRPHAGIFDYYERTHLNHILAQQNPRTGMFAYMTPLLAGSARAYSTPFDDFWCCVGTGMESHAKHGDSVWWHDGRETILVNLFVPSRLDWAGIRLVLDTDYPKSGHVTLRVEHAPRRPLALRVRLPSWSGETAVSLNDAVLPATADPDGYLSLRRCWNDGDRLELVFDMRLRLEHPAGSAGLATVLRGPAVLAVDLGPADRPWDGLAPALVGGSVLDNLVREGDGYRARGVGRPDDFLLTAFAFQHERRSAVYLPVFDATGWSREQARLRAEQAAARALAARSVDLFHPGEMQSERDHALDARSSFPVVYRGRNGRDARAGGFFAFRMRTRPGPLELRATYWGEERDHDFLILVEGSVIATERLTGGRTGLFFDRTYRIPDSLTEGKDGITVRFEPLPDRTAGPVFGVACLSAASPQAIPDQP